MTSTIQIRRGDNMFRFYMISNCEIYNLIQMIYIPNFQSHKYFAKQFYLKDTIPVRNENLTEMAEIRRIYNKNLRLAPENYGFSMWLVP